MKTFPKLMAIYGCDIQALAFATINLECQLRMPVAAGVLNTESRYELFGVTKPLVRCIFIFFCYTYKVRTL